MNDNRGLIFHNDISIWLETDARGLLQDKIHTEEFDATIFKADRIDAGCFAEAMILLLEFKRNFVCDEEVSHFVQSCGEYLGKSKNEIPEETAKKLYDEYCALFGRE